MQSFHSWIAPLCLSIATLTSACGSGTVSGSSNGAGDLPADDFSDTGTCTVHDDCDDSLYCNGQERCENGFCRPGQLVRCSDSVDCTRDVCDEATDSCQNTPNHAACGQGMCDPRQGCTGGGDRCASNDDCDDGTFCNGSEVCGPNGACQSGQAVECDDGNDCTIDICSERLRACDHQMRDADNDGFGDAACRGGDDCDDNDAATNSHAREVCADGRDNDCDRQRDCTDPQCSGSPDCGGRDERDDRREDCDDGRDNDGDARVDCDDSDCDSDRDCAAGGGGENCTDGRDNDADGRIDCNDPLCTNDPACRGGARELCSDGWDNDGDGRVDCNDHDCANDRACGGGGGAGENCTDGRDNDGDGRIDCNDPLCTNDRACVRAGREVCNDAVDNDADGRADCFDGDCVNDPACRGAGREVCNDGRDNDGDGLRDCSDGDCTSDLACRAGAGEVCNDGRDNDNDGRIDCLDPLCIDDPACRRAREVCTDGSDNDGDGRADCNDADCSNDPGCQRDDVSDYEGDPCEQNGWYGDGVCDSVCWYRDSDCDLVLDACGARDLYGDGTCDDACPQEDRDCPADGTDRCRLAHNGTCDEDGTVNGCASGTDTSDCRPGEANQGPSSCRWANDGVCDERLYCPTGTDGDDCVSGPDSCYWVYDGRCDREPVCAAGTDTHDCGQDDGAQGGACGGLTYQGRCVGSDTIEYCLNAGRDDERRETLRCEAGQECRWASAEMGYLCMAPDEGSCGANDECDDQDTGRVPGDWSCNGSYYDNNDGCDCDCGVLDPDCSDDDQPVLGCQDGEYCNAMGRCSAGTSTVPDGWTCNESFYDANDGCDCECGELDPDCNDDDQAVYNCEDGDGYYCDWNGHCAGGPTPPTNTCGGETDAGRCDGDTLIWCDADGVIQQHNCAAEGQECGSLESEQWHLCVTPTRQVPASWSCPESFYGQGDGCDCECGDYDPDCDAGQTVYGCTAEQYCGWDGHCADWL